MEIDLADVEFERLQLDEHSWVDIARGWLQGDQELYRLMADGVRWQQGKVFRYDHYVEEPRLGGWAQAGVDDPHPTLLEAHRRLQHRYHVRYDGYALAWYRDGRDSVAFHRDRELRWLDDTVIGILTIGARRPFLVRPRANRYAHDLPDKGATHDLAPSGGDLLVMGGRTQADWEHSVPKVHPATAGRMSVQWRWTSRRGRPEVGGNWSSPRLYGQG